LKSPDSKKQKKGKRGVWGQRKSLTDLDNLPEPEELAEEIIENIEAGLASLKAVLAGLSSSG